MERLFTTQRRPPRAIGAIQMNANTNGSSSQQHAYLAARVYAHNQKLRQSMNNAMYSNLVPTAAGAIAVGSSKPVRSVSPDSVSGSNITIGALSLSKMKRTPKPSTKRSATKEGRHATIILRFANEWNTTNSIL
jgi:hypothetical protein